MRTSVCNPSHSVGNKVKADGWENSGNFSVIIASFTHQSISLPLFLGRQTHRRILQDPLHSSEERGIAPATPAPRKALSLGPDTVSPDFVLCLQS